MKKRLITLIAIGALIGAVQTGTAQDTAAYLVMIANQGTQISNQVQTLMRMDTHITQLTGQFEHLKESALGQIGAIADPIADLVAVPTDLLNTTRDWHSDFTGQAGSLIDALTGLSAGTSLSESWRDVLETADTVTEADIRNIYQGGGADEAVRTFERRRDYADRSVVLAHAQADAAASLAATAVETQDKIDTVAGENNVSTTALQQAVLAGNHSQGQLPNALDRNWPHAGRLGRNRRRRYAYFRRKRNAAGRSRRNGWPIVPLSKRSGPRSERTWPHGPTNGLNPCMAAIDSRPSLTGIDDDPGADAAVRSRHPGRSGRGSGPRDRCIRHHGSGGAGGRAANPHGRFRPVAGARGNSGRLDRIAGRFYRRLPPVGRGSCRHRPLVSVGDAHLL